MLLDIIKSSDVIVSYCQCITNQQRTETSSRMSKGFMYIGSNVSSLKPRLTDLLTRVKSRDASASKNLDKVRLEGRLFSLLRGFGRRQDDTPVRMQNEG